MQIFPAIQLTKGIVEQMSDEGLYDIFLHETNFTDATLSYVRDEIDRRVMTFTEMETDEMFVSLQNGYWG